MCEKDIHSQKENKTGELIMLCGLPGSGKSHYANLISKENSEIKVFSSDALRKEIFGDENIQGTSEDKEKLFVELHRRIKTWLSEGGTAVYDATNLNKKRRIAFLHELTNIPCYKKCVLFCIPYKECLQNNNKRERVVPEEVIKKMYMNFQPPHESEGWDNMKIIFHKSSSHANYHLDYIEEKWKEIDGFKQENKHHELSLDMHLEETERYLIEKVPEDELLQITGLLHDIGKPFTKTYLNAKGEEDGDCHYYQHHCVGAYESIIHAVFEYSDICINVNDVLDVSNLIYYHMHPYCSWNQSEKAKEKDKELLGNKFFERVMKLHEADVAAH